MSIYYICVYVCIYIWGMIGKMYVDQTCSMIYLCGMGCHGAKDCKRRSLHEADPAKSSPQAHPRNHLEADASNFPSYPLVIMENPRTEWRFLARKITDFYGPFSSTPCLTTRG